MGRWTLRHIDEVLVTKLENIINAAIRRTREDTDSKTKLSLSYENFVESLDEEDAFTTAVIEILLKELADRRMRPSIDDQKLISRWTAESLHQLAVPAKVFDPVTAGYTRYRNRSTANLNAPPFPLYTPADSDEDELNIGDGMGGIEGARIDSALYDVYNAGQAGNPRVYPPAPALSSTLRSDDSNTMARSYEEASIPGRQLPVPHNNFIPGGQRRWTSVFGSNSNSGSTNLPSAPLVRRPIMRRVRLPEAHNSAVSEFSEFSARRRSNQRQRENRSRAIREEHAAARDALLAVRPPSSTSYNNLPRASLFDPPSPSGHDNNSPRVPSPSPSTEGDEAQGNRMPRASQNRGFLHDSRESNDAEFWRWADSVAPRLPLRRGGIQPPETMLPSAESIAPPSSDSLAREFGTSSLLRPEGDEGVWFIDDQSFGNRQQEPSSSSLPPQEAPVSLPTPRSVSPSEENASSGPTSGAAAS